MFWVSRGCPKAEYEFARDGQAEELCRFSILEQDGVLASVITMAEDFGRCDLTVRVRHVSPLKNAAIQFRALPMRRVWTSFPDVLCPSFACATTAQRLAKNGLTWGTTPATKERAPANDLNCLRPTTGLDMKVSHVLRSSSIFSFGIVTLVAFRSSSVSILAPIQVTCDPASAFASFRGKPVTSNQSRPAPRCSFQFGSFSSYVISGSSTYVCTLRFGQVAMRDLDSHAANRPHNVGDDTEPNTKTS